MLTDGDCAQPLIPMSEKLPYCVRNGWKAKAGTVLKKAFVRVSWKNVSNFVAFMIDKENVFGYIYTRSLWLNTHRNGGG